MYEQAGGNGRIGLPRKSGHFRILHYWGDCTYHKDNMSKPDNNGCPICHLKSDSRLITTLDHLNAAYRSRLIAFKQLYCPRQQIGQFTGEQAGVAGIERAGRAV